MGVANAAQPAGRVCARDSRISYLDYRIDRGLSRFVARGHGFRTKFGRLMPIIKWHGNPKEGVPLMCADGVVRGNG